MDEEEFDELSMDRSSMSMGSRNSRTSANSRNSERANPYSENTTAPDPNPQLFRSQSSGRSSGSAPPSFAFNSGNSNNMDSRAASPPPEASTGRAFGENDAQIARTLSQSPESRRIRQEALRMLEVADDQLHDGAYSVYRTSTGGFAAEPRKASEEKRVPSALSGLSFASSRKNVARPFRDDPYADTEAPVPTSQESYEYGDDSAVVDVAKIESRSAAARAASPSNNWSSRYSLDNTLLALSGGSVTSSKFLDKMDEDNRKSARSNIFNSGPSATKSPQVFGSGFSFRSSNVFGQQSKQETNLKSSWMESAVETPASPARSWQEQFIKKRRQRRRAIIVVVAIIVALVFLIIEFEPHKKLNSSGSSNSSSGSASPNTKVVVDEDPSVDGISFYVTSDVPLHSVRDETFMTDMKSMNRKAAFMAHLGDVQLATNTLCKPQRYNEVSQILRGSPLPVFVLPGEEDWANCLDQSDGWANWVDAFWKFENNFETDFKVYRMEGQEENFAFVEDDVLFVGVHEHNGRIVNHEEHKKRNHRNVECKCVWADLIASSTNLVFSHLD